MLIIKTGSIYECVCDACKHSWTTLNLPKRCASCKRGSWNSGGPRKYTKAKKKRKP